MALDQDTAALLRRLEELGGGAERDMAALEPAAARAASQHIWEAFAGDEISPCHVEPLLLPGPAAPIPARLYRPPASARQGPLQPLVVFLHGGGWALGDLDGYEPLVKSLCAGSGAVFLSVDYRLAPEHKFPAGLEDALGAVTWAIDHAAAMGCDPARLGVMGDSAGGNLATVIARRLAGNAKRPAAQFLIYPVLDVASPHEQYPSRMRNGDGSLLLARRDIDATTAWYLDGGTDPRDPAISPLLAPDLSSLPPTVILTAGFDPLLDEAKRYAERLHAAGVTTEFRCFGTTIHAFLSFGVLPVAREARAWLAERVARYL